GIAAGDGTFAAPSGLFATADGGKTWLSIPGSRATSWVSGSFTNLSNGVLVDSGGVYCKYERGKFKEPQFIDVQQSVRAMWGDAEWEVCVGDCGLAEVPNSRMGGGLYPHPDHAANRLRNLNLGTVARHGKTFWAAGSPGSVVLRSTDEGKSWETLKTGWNLPLHALAAASESDVFAVGELGAILKSSDGGKTWTLQRSGGQRSAVLFAHAFAKNVPLDAMSAVGARDGYFAAATTFCGNNPADHFRLSAAVRMSGGVGSDSGPVLTVPSLLADAKPEELLANWGKDAEEQLVRRLVLAFRMWTPEVVVSDFVSTATGPAEQLVLKAAQKAFKLADDPKAYPEQIETLGLKPFGPKKLYAMCPPAEANVKMDQTTFARTLVDTPQGSTENAFGILGDKLSPPAVRGFVLVSHRSPGCEKHTDITSGLEFAEGGTARRKLPSFGGDFEEAFKTAQTAAEQRRTLESLLLAADTPMKLQSAIGQAGRALTKMPNDYACRTAVGLGRQLAEQGRWGTAREMYLLAATRYGTFAEANEAVRWLVRHHASGEARRRADVANAANEVIQVGDVPPTKFTDGETAQTWAKGCLELEAKLTAFGTSADRDPAVMMSTLAAKRTVGRTADAAEQVAAYFKSAAGAKELKPGEDLWRDCIAAELWLNNREAVAQPKPFALCPKTTARPHLDGKLADDCWKGIKPLSLDGTRGEVKEYGTKAYFTCDEEYLYFAVECSHPTGKSLPKAEKRRRDDDLRGKDRVDILLDLDRDYQSYYRLQIDQTGCVADDCTGDSGWNPKWFVAVEPTATGWTAEIAIPRTELTGGLFKAGGTWGMNVTRVVPGVGCRTWSGPADSAAKPEGMGLMQFHEVK
ncbi:MAG: YCF48-related protein, partial [Armatimonadaceae bacterium]